MCSTTPRFSYGCPETCVQVVTLAYMVCGAGWYQGGYTGWGTGRVYQGGYTGWVYREAIPGTQPCCSGSPPETAERARRPCRGRSGGLRWAGEPAAPGTVPAHPCGARSVPTGPPWLGPCKCRLLANMARFHDIPQKVSQNRQVSPGSVEKACHSPQYPKRVQEVTS